MLACQFEGFVSVEGRVDLLSQGPEQKLQALGVASLVVDDQDPAARQLRIARAIGAVRYGQPRPASTALPWETNHEFAPLAGPCAVGRHAAAVQLDQ